MGDFDPKFVLEGILVLLFSIGLHEFAHAKAADMSGDNTPRANGRVSLNPLDHFDPLGAMMILFTLVMGFGIGWGKPVPVNPYNFRNPRRDNIIVSLAGPMTNILIAVMFGLLIRFGAGVLIQDQMMFSLAMRFVTVNLVLAFFNLIPVPPLDGSHIMANILPGGMGRQYAITMGRWGMMILIMLLITGVIGDIIKPPVEYFSGIILGL